MLKEPHKIILRRFYDRPLESGLLVLAVALGIGAFSAGFSLLMNTVSYSHELLSSPEYKELIFSTRSNSKEMETPVRKKLVQENAVLKVSDLEAAKLASGVQWAFVQNRARLRLISGDSQNYAPPEEMGPPVPPGAAQEDTPDTQQPDKNSGNNFFRISDDERAAAEADESVVLSELDEISGYEVTPQFFNAWGITVSDGSLFTDTDLNSTANIIVLGSKLASLIAGDGNNPSDLLGKKLLTREGYQTIIGITNPVSAEYDSEYFAPYRDQSGGVSGFRRRFMDTQLRFAVHDPSDLDQTAELLKNWFAAQFGEDQITVSNPRAEAMQLVKRNRGIGVLILFLSAAGFFIALVNVSNILISRVLRLKKGVGILMAVGAAKNDIMNLFLLETVLIALLGGAAGTALALPLSNYMREAAGITTTSWLFTAAGVALSGIVTVLFGIIPSRQYMKIDPAEAIRS